MYLKIETQTSYEYLQKVVSVLQEPICILGGWAVYLTVNDNYKKNVGKEYLGSRDIDLGFHLDKNASEKEMKQSSFYLALKTLEKDGFELTSFRLVKHLDRETGKVLSQEEYVKKDQFDLIEMYVDLIVDNLPNGFKKTFKMNLIDETLLAPVFENPKNHITLTEFKKKLILPKPSLLLATKLKSLPGRDKEHKRQKDIYDIAALLLYAPKRIDGSELKQFLPTKSLKSIKQINDKEIEKTESSLGLQKNQFKTAVLALKKEIE